MATENAIVGQSGGPTAAINATLSGVIRGVLNKQDKINVLYGMRNGIEGLLRENIVDLNKIFKSEKELLLLENTPAAALGSCRLKLNSADTDEKVYIEIFNIFKKYNIRYFFYIGGNDSMDTAEKINAYAEKINYAIKVIGIPKTIDNDLTETDHTPGYGSAAKYIAASVQEIIRDCAVYSVNAVTIVEIMGRDAGWLTAAAGLPGAINGISPDHIYLPEKPFDIEKFISGAEKALANHPNVVIAVSEGLRDNKGTYIGEAAYKGKDAFGHVNLSGTGRNLEIAVKETLKCKVRSVELNILQRCAAHIASKTDLDESVLIGKEAVNASCNGITGKMMCFKRISDAPYKITIDTTDVKLIANSIKKVPDNFINSAGNYVTDECLDYIKPLIYGEASISYKDGLPVHFII